MSALLAVLVGYRKIYESRGRPTLPSEAEQQPRGRNESSIDVTKVGSNSNLSASTARLVSSPQPEDRAAAFEHAKGGKLIDGFGKPNEAAIYGIVGSVEVAHQVSERVNAAMELIQTALGNKNEGISEASFKPGTKVILKGFDDREMSKITDSLHVSLIAITAESAAKLLTKKFEEEISRYSHSLEIETVITEPGGAIFSGIASSVPVTYRVIERDATGIVSDVKRMGCPGPFVRQFLGGTKLER